MMGNWMIEGYPWVSGNLHVMIRKFLDGLPGSFTWTFLMAFSAEDPDCEVGPVSRKERMVQLKHQM